MQKSAENLVVVGKITMPYGIKGWVKIYSYTDPIDNILHYQPWQLCRQNQCESAKVVEGRVHGKFIVAQLAHVTDRNAAERMRGLEIAVPRDQLPEAGEGEYYWIDLQGLEVISVSGQSLGKVDSVMETGANDVLVVKGDRERLIPYVKNSVVREVNLDQGTILVDWDVDF